MATARATRYAPYQPWVVVRMQSAGQFKAEMVGLPEVHATGATREEALQKIHTVLGQWIASGKLVPVEIAPTEPLLSFSAHLDPNDPLEVEFVEELKRQRREDLERTLAEDDQQCPNSSSTPTT